MAGELFITAPRGVEPALADELRALGADAVELVPGGVRASGSQELGYKVCLWSRCGGRVLWRVGESAAHDADALYAGAREVPWCEHLAPGNTFAVDVVGSSPWLDNAQYGVLRIKDAVVDRLREERGARPSVGRTRPDLRIHAYLDGERAVLSVDFAGESLHRRGYRPASAEAPLKENLAAGLLLLAGWPAVAAAGAPLLDPMCGSGTFVVEAALIAADTAPGLLRERFGFAGWRGHDAALWQRLVADARRRDRRGSQDGGPRVFGHDADGRALGRARAAAAAAGVSDLVALRRQALRDCAPPEGVQEGLLVTNPPYGVRLGQGQALGGLYAQLGDVLKQRFAGWTAQLLVGDRQLEKSVGLRPDRKLAVSNGAIACRWLRYPLRAPQSAAAAAAAQPAPSSPPPASVAAAAPAPLRGLAARLSPGAPVQAFVNRLRKNVRHFGRWARRGGVSCYRLYDADLPEYAFAVDRYGPRVCVQEYAPPSTVDAQRAASRVREVLAVLPEVLAVEPTDVYFKVRRRQRRGEQYERGRRSSALLEVEEGGLRFLVNLADYIDTGLYLDHRLTRGLVRELAAGRRFLNLFCYTGSATVYAAAGGARSTTSVDLSQTYLDWARRNLELNGFGGRAHELVHDDCLGWLRQERRRYGLIFLDAPTFSNSKRMRRELDLQRDHGTLIRDAARLLEPDGVLLFSTHGRSFQLDQQALAAHAPQDWTRRTIPEDFVRRPRVHQVWCLSRAAGR